MNKGSIELRFGGKLKRNIKAFVPDEDSEEYKKRIFLKGAFGRLILMVYDQIIAKSQVDYYKAFFGESQKLFDEIKAFLQIYA